MSTEELEKSYGIPPYKAVQMIKQATKIIDTLLTGSTSFTQPYHEAKMVVEIADRLLDQMISLQKGSDS